MAKDKKSRLTRYVGLLKAKYGAEFRHEDRTAMEELILSILAEGTNDPVARRALNRLREEFVDWNEVRVSRGREVAEAVAFLPDAPRKAERIRKVLDQICGIQDEVALDFLEDVTPEEAVVQLLAFEGVGARQVADVLSASYGEVPVVVDERIKRVLERLGIVEPGTADKALEAMIPRLVPKERLLLFYHVVSDHAERICTPTDYQCKICVLRQECRFYKENVEGVEKGSGRK